MGGQYAQQGVVPESLLSLRYGNFPVNLGVIFQKLSRGTHERRTLEKPAVVRSVHSFLLFYAISPSTVDPKGIS